MLKIKTRPKYGFSPFERAINNALRETTSISSFQQFFTSIDDWALG